MLDKLYDNGQHVVYDDVGQHVMYEDVQTNNHDHVVYNTSINQMVPDVSTDNQLIVCTGCGTRIVDRYFLLVAEQHWHVPCLRCCDCNIQLDSQLTCFARDGNIYCKQDYYRRYSMRSCSRCHVTVSSHELVMRAKDLIFHIDCFTCGSCNRLLNTGDTYGIHGNQIFCQDDYEMLLNNYNGDDYRQVASCMTGPPEMIEFYNGLGPLQKGRPRKRKHMMSAEDCLQTLGMITNERGDIIPRDNFHSSHSPRQKRVRTSFKHHQLRTMKSYFALNHNPDAKDLKQLSQKTQLSKRVLQVWFQNARAKYRRSQSKQDGDNPENGATSLTTTPEDAEHLLDLSKCPSPALSDVSSSQSMSDSLEIMENGQSGDDTLTELFSDGNNSA